MRNKIDIEYELFLQKEKNSPKEIIEKSKQQQSLIIDCVESYEKKCMSRLATEQFNNNNNKDLAAKYLFSVIKAENGLKEINPAVINYRLVAEIYEAIHQVLYSIQKELFSHSSILFLNKQRYENLFHYDQDDVEKRRSISYFGVLICISDQFISQNHCHLLT